MKEVMYDSIGVSHIRTTQRDIIEAAPRQCLGCPELTQLSYELARLVTEQDLPIETAQRAVSEKINPITCRYGLLAIEGCIGEEEPRCSLGVISKLYT